MKLRSFLLVLALFVAVLAVALVPQAMAQEQPAAGAKAPEQQKQITDRAEYDVYVAAAGEADLAKRAAALDAFLKKYPNTVVKEDALAGKMNAEFGSNQLPAAQQTAREVLNVNPRNVLALNIAVTVFLGTPAQATDPQRLSEAEQWAKTGLEALPSFTVPGANVTPQQLEQAKKEIGALFHQTLGFVALQKKSYSVAGSELGQAAQASPNNLVVIYQLATAYYLDKQYSKALYAYARVAGYTGPGALAEQGRTAIDKQLRDIYIKYHGADDGLAELKTQAAATPFPPGDFHIDSVAEAEAKKPVEPDKMDFYEIREMLLSNTPKAEELWNKLKGATRTFKGGVVSATPDPKPKVLRIVVTQDTAKKGGGAYDVELVLAAPMAKAPTEVIDFTGVVNAYAKAPFTLTMVDGKVPEEPAVKKTPAGAKKPAATAKKPVAKKP